MKTRSLPSYLDAAILLTSVTATLYFFGWVYYASYFEALGLNISFLSIPFESYVMASWVDVGRLLMTIVVLNFMYRLIAWSGTGRPFDDLRKAFSKRPKLDSFMRTVGSSIVLLVSFLAFVHYTMKVVSRAERDAAEQIQSKRRIEFVTKTEMKLPAAVYFLTYSDDKYVVCGTPSDKARPQVYIINASEVASATFVKE
jgi:hypothetical protein